MANTHRLRVLSHAERVGFVLMAVAAVGYMPWPQLAPWLMSVGAAAVAVAHLAERYDGSDVRQRRNNRTRHLVGIVYVVAAYLMFRPGMYWVVALLVGVVLELYTLYVTSRADE